MYLESMHKTLKYCVYEKKVIRRLDHSIFLVTVLFNDIYGDYLQKSCKPSSNKKTAAIFKNHQLSLKSAKDFTVEKDPDLEGLIVKDLNSSCDYKISLSETRSHECYLACVQCGFCLHTFKCSCRENISKGQFCIHLHMLSSVPSLLPNFERPINRQFDFFYKNEKQNKSSLVISNEIETSIETPALVDNNWAKSDDNQGDFPEMENDFADSNDWTSTYIDTCILIHILVHVLMK